MRRAEIIFIVGATKSHSQYTRRPSEFELQVKRTMLFEQ